jgi:hypothetical protein
MLLVIKSRNFTWNVTVPAAWFLNNKVTKIIEGRSGFSLQTGEAAETETVLLQPSRLRGKTGGN